MSHAVFFSAYCLGHIQSVVCQYEIVDFCLLSHVVAAIRAAGSGSSKTNVRPRWNSLNQFLTIAIEGKESPYTAAKRWLILLCQFPSKNTNRITNRYCSCSIFQKPTSTRGQNKTTRPIRLKLWKLLYNIRECTTWQ